MLKLQEQAESSLLLATPVWEAADASVGDVEYAERHVIVCEPAAGDENVAQRYGRHALACFERIRTILQAKPQGKVLVQIVVDEHETGLSALLKTAALENPQIVGELIVAGGRQVLRWQEIPPGPEKPPVAFENGGVYLITGGLGGLGVLFAEEILGQTSDARVVLTGRGAKRDLLDDARVSYRQLNVCDPDQVEQLIAAVIAEHGRLDGILHCAGMLADNFILKKTAAEFRDVLAPKVTGTFHLDQATKDLDLDFFVLFSSIAGAMGNVGQADYAAANGFLDQFAVHRNRLVAAGQRHGRTRSINWPLWEAGGMGADPATAELLQQATGMQPMRTATGMDVFHRALALPHDQLLVAEGDLAQIRRALHGRQPAESSSTAAAPPDEGKTEDYLRRQCAELLKLPFQAIDPQAPLEQYGIDSLLAMRLTNHLEKTFGTLSKTLFFECQTIRELAGYFAQSHAARLAALFGQAEPLPPARSKRRHHVRRKAAEEPIAIIGLSGRYPEAVDIEAYWENLRDGRDCIVEVPKERWDWREYYSEDRTEGGRHYSKWGGFIAGVDEFDPLFFGISPREAKLIDPQERLFLQHAWMAVEDAGYTRAGLQVPRDQDLPGQVGVYAGVMYTEYQLFGGPRLGINNSAASIANRVSYALNLHGPSLTLDTMCSSSLTAIHFACLDLKLGRTDLAIAGGVNVSIHPSKYLMLSAGQFISGEGHCQSFGEGGDGYIPGEGVGVVLLKRLSDAERDGDHVYGVIRGSALNHGGKTNGYTVPNPQAQATAISRALAESHTDARHISYIEAHGTGTKLGDPIEIAALGKAFQRDTRDTAFCLIGSAKSNIGHCESAAGIAGLTKVLLQIKHQQIAPSLHSAQLNPHIDFENTPFVVNQALRPWEQPVIDGRKLPRIAGISSFGAGGSNAHLIIEEHEAPAAQPIAGKMAILLSARTAEQLEQKARDLLRFVASGTPDLAAMAYTLHVGREAMDERLGIVVSSVEQLAEKLQAYVDGRQGIEDVHRGRRNRETRVHAADGLQVSELVDLWVKGLELDWSRLHGQVRPRRMSLPTYPFARERFWVEIEAAKAPAAAVLHPLLHRNTSDLAEQSYSSTFSGDEFFLRQPAAAYLEMARAAVQKASRHSAETILELRDVVWGQPVAIAGKTDVSIALLANDGERIDFEIHTGEIVHCQGRAVLSGQPAPPPLDVAQLALTRLRLPESLKETAGDYVLHPALMNAALALSGRQRPPSALDMLRIVAPCSGDMFASVRQAADKVDIDLCDDRGHIAVQLRGLAWRAAAPAQEITEPVARKKPSAISLSAPSALVPIEASASRAAVTLPDAAPAARLHDRGNGVFSIEIGPATDAKQALESAQREPAIKVLMLSGIEHGFVGGGQEEYELLQLLAAFPYPVIAVMPRDVIGVGFAAAALCDVMVCSEDAHYGESPSTGTQLRAEGWTCPILPPARVEAYAQELAATLAAKPQDALRLLKQHLSRHVVEALKSVDAAFKALPDLRRVLGEPRGNAWLSAQYCDAEQQDEAAQPLTAPAPIALRSTVVTATAHPDGIVVVKMEDREAKNMFSEALVEGIAEAFAHIDQSPAYKVVILTGYDDYFASGGTKESLLAIQEGRARFTDVSTYQTALDCRLPVIAAMQGHGIGAGWTLGMFADLPLLSAESRYVSPYMNYGFTPGAGATYILGETIGPELARESLLTARPYTGRELEQRGIRIPVLPREEVLPAAMALARRIAQAPRDRLIALKQQLTAHMREPLEETYRLELAMHEQTFVGRPDTLARIETNFHQPASPQSQPERVDGDALPAVTATLRALLAAGLQMRESDIDDDAQFTDLGLDSVAGVSWIRRINDEYQISIEATRIYSYPTLAQLSRFVKEEVERRGALPAADAKPAVDVPPPAERLTSFRGRKKSRLTSAPAAQRIAVIGMAGQFPQANDLEEFWRNLVEGRNCIGEVPRNRWDLHAFHQAGEAIAGKTNCSWAGMLDGYDLFDPLFFNISPTEAESMDPQQRLFLQACWHGIEHAGYAAQSLSGSKCGVFVGCATNGEYHQPSRQHQLSAQGFTGSAMSILAARISYLLNLQGPCISIDTACSSSLIAIAQACDSLVSGDSDAALAGGVYVMVGPEMHIKTSQTGMLSPEGRCFTFDQRADGFVPGEGVGVVMLKRLADAERDGDTIYAVIEGWGVNQDGKTNGITAPNPDSQTRLEQAVYDKYRIDPAGIQLIETHGTGTKLGDPIEVDGLKNAFAKYTQHKSYCALGSVKSNIGHTLTAAGVAGVIKL
ncbi:MAG TPA: SDR family NAD(P)-dependent oxidoreductase, partial [Thermoanaerobaculia bacterium]|nr:SDR family NAD(P)-dependent oxidoreductase [Thermoanaerobaculia bacterium]